MGHYRTRPVPPPLPVREPAVHPVHAGRRVLVTGGAGFLGRETARLLCRQGAAVAIADLAATPLDETAAGIEAEAGPHGGRCIAIAMDVGDPASVEAGCALAIERLGGLDGLVNAAAIVPHADPLEVPLADWRAVFEVNLFGAYEACRRVARHMIDARARGAIVNVASEAGKRGHLDSLAYSASKAALISATRMLAEALAPHDVNVNAVCPGGLETPMLREVARAYSAVTGDAEEIVWDAMKSDQLGRHLQPAEVARTISFLLGDEAVLVRGQAINTDAGETVG